MTATPSPPRRPTIQQVARLAGVSHQTVSRYLRFDGDGLKPSTRESVEAAIAELNYRPNLAARSMRTRTTGRVAVLLPALAFNPARMLAGATQAAHHAGYQVDVISPEGGADSRAARILELADTRQVDGILSFAPATITEEQRPSDVCIVVSEDFDDEMRGIGTLASAEPVSEIVGRLAELGHRRFYHVAGPAGFASARARASTYSAVVEELGLESVGVFHGDWTGNSGIDAVRAVKPGEEPTAIIAANDLVAAGVLKGAAERGWDVPGTVSVTGWDDDPIAPFLSPALTSVSVDLESIGRNAMARLITQLGGVTAPVADEPVYRVVWRDSTGIAPAL